MMKNNAVPPPPHEKRLPPQTKQLSVRNILIVFASKNPLHYSGLGKCDCLAAWIYNGRQPGRHWDKGSGACVFTAECLSEGGCGDCGGDFTVMLCTCRFYILYKCLGDKEIQRDGHV